MEEKTTTAPESDLAPAGPELEEVELETTVDYFTGEVLTTYPVEIDVTEAERQRLASAQYIDPLTKPSLSWFLEQDKKELAAELEKKDDSLG
jgi:hypothetical protein